MKYIPVMINLNFGDASNIAKTGSTQISPQQFLGQYQEGQPVQGMVVLITPRQLKQFQGSKPFTFKMSKSQIKANELYGSGFVDWIKGAAKTVYKGLKKAGNAIKDNAPAILKEGARYGLQYGLPIATQALSNYNPLAGQLLGAVGGVAQGALNGSAEQPPMEGGSINPYMGLKSQVGQMMGERRRFRTMESLDPLTGGASRLSLEMSSGYTKKGRKIKPENIHTFVPPAQQLTQQGSGILSTWTR